METVRGQAAIEAQRARIRSFFPLTIVPTDPDPAGFIKVELELAEVSLSTAAEGLGQVIDRWRIGSEGADGAAFALRLASLLGTPKLPDRLARLLGRPAQTDEKGSRAVTLAASAILTAWPDADENTTVLEALADKKWLKSVDAARLLPRLAGRDLWRLNQLVVLAAPELPALDPGDAARTALGRTMLAAGRWSRGDAEETGWLHDVLAEATRAGLNRQHAARLEVGDMIERAIMSLDDLEGDLRQLRAWGARPCPPGLRLRRVEMAHE